MKLSFVCFLCFYDFVAETALIEFQDQISDLFRNEYDKVPSKINSIPKKKQQYINEITIKVIVHFDYQLTEKLTKKMNKTNRNFLRSVAKVLVRDVEEIYNDPDLGVKVHFSLKDVKFLKKNAQFSTNEVEASVYLKSYCNWQASLKMTKGQRHYSVLLTSFELTEEPEENEAEYASRAFKSSMCIQEESCTVQEWIPEKLAYNLAAAIGYSLGMSFDVPPVAICEDKQSIMDLDFKPREDKAYWTECNARDLNYYLSNGQANCIIQNERDKKIALANKIRKNRVL